jgi:hypothetical protein
MNKALKIDTENKSPIKTSNSMRRIIDGGRKEYYRIGISKKNSDATDVRKMCCTSHRMEMERKKIS